MPNVQSAREVRASYPQERIWFVHQLAPDSGSYNVILNYIVRDGQGLDALKWAIERLCERHEVLRTTFTERAGIVYQIIKPHIEIEMSQIDRKYETEGDYAADLDRLTQQELRRPFNLETGPLIRCTTLLSPSGQLVASICLHHIVSDGWSTTVMCRDLDQLCDDFRSTGTVSLPPLPVQYVDYSEWQRSRSNGPKLQAQVAYWLGQLKDAPPVIELPLDRPRTADPQMVGKVKMFAIPVETAKAVSALAGRKQATIFMILVAALKALLFRMTGQEDIVFATVVANRTRVELESMIGCFLNNLVLRDKLRADMTFEQLAEQVRDTTLDAYTNQDVPFELIVEKLNLPRSLSHNAVFQVMVAFQNFIDGAGFEPGSVNEKMIAGEIVTTPSIAKFEMALSMWEAGDALAGGVEYRSDLFDDPTIDRFIGHFKTLLADAAARPDCALHHLKVLDDKEYDTVVRAWNSWELDYPKDQLIHTMVAAQAERTPDAIAVVLGDASLTYLDLNRRSNCVASYLIELGCKPERIVGIMLDQSLDMIVSMLGILKAGGAYLPIDPHIPSERLAYIVRDAEPLTVLTSAEWTGVLTGAGARAVVVDEWINQAGAAFDPNPRLVQSSRSLAYVLYTSGSTGNPKGVMVEHRSVLHHLWGMDLQYRFSSSDCFFQSHSYAFDVSVWELFLPLVVGARVAMVKPDGHKDPAYLVDAMIRAGVTYACLLPPMLQMVLDEPRVQELNRTLQWAICGGEPLSPDLVSRFFSMMTARLDNAYGPTETTVHNTYYHCERGEQPGNIPIGRAMPGAKVYILDAHMNPMPVGAPGEICIGGDAVARGYLKRPDLTAEKFVHDPFSDEMGARLYRTGDIGRFLVDGNIEFQGRRDMQIKLRGFRIELGEITQSLKQHAAVHDCFTIVREDRPGDRRIVSYVVTDDRSDIVRQLQDYLSSRLPEHMLPSTILRIPKLPLKDSNKVDMAALPPPSAMMRSKGFMAPRNDVELQLAEIWKDLLGVQEVGVDESFFELGGHSLLVTRLISRIRADMGATLSIRQVFRSPLLSDLAIAVQIAREASDRDPDDEAFIPRRASAATS